MFLSLYNEKFPESIRTFFSKPNIESDYSEIRLKALNMIADQNELTKIALSKHQYKEIRHAAISKIDDQTLLAKIVIEAEKSEISMKAISLMNDRELL